MVVGPSVVGSSVEESDDEDMLPFVDSLSSVVSDSEPVVEFVVGFIVVVVGLKVSLAVDVSSPPPQPIRTRDKAKPSCVV